MAANKNLNNDTTVVLEKILFMELDFSRCIICQQETDEQLKCPLLSPGPIKR